MTFIRRTGTALLVAIAGLALAPVGAGSIGSASAASNETLIRAAHFSPTTPGVDVYLTPFNGAATRTAWLSGVTYGTVSGYETLTPGTYTISMRLAGANPSTPPALSWVLDAKPGAAYTIAGVGSGAAVRGVVIPDDLTTPPSGSGLVRVIQAASRAPSVNVTGATGQVIAQDAQFATVTSYIGVSAGTTQVTVASTSDPSVTTAIPLSIKSGQVDSLLLLDAPGSGITTRVLLDAAAAGTVPIGAVAAGGGGTADRSASSEPLVWTSAALLLVALAVTTLTVGRGRPRRVPAHRVTG